MRFRSGRSRNAAPVHIHSKAHYKQGAACPEEGAGADVRRFVGAVPRFERVAGVDSSENGTLIENISHRCIGNGTKAIAEAEGVRNTPVEIHTEAIADREGPKRRFPCAKD